MERVKPIEITTMLAIAIDDIYQSEVVETEMEELMEQTKEEWKFDKFDELLNSAKQQIENERLFDEGMKGGRDGL